MLSIAADIATMFALYVLQQLTTVGLLGFANGAYVAMLMFLCITK